MPGRSAAWWVFGGLGLLLLLASSASDSDVSGPQRAFGATSLAICGLLLGARFLRAWWARRRLAQDEAALTAARPLFTRTENSASAMAPPAALILNCTQCGAPVEARPEDDAAICTHCKTFLLLLREGEPLPCRVACPDFSEEQLCEAWLTRAVALFKSKLKDEVARLRANDDSKAARAQERTIVSRTEAEERRLGLLLVLREKRLIHVPYFHARGLIAQALFARDESGEKQNLVRAFLAEDTRPAYDTSQFDFRDRELRLSHQRMCLLKSDDRDEGLVALALAHGPGSSTTRLRRWLGRPLVQGLSPLALQGELVGQRQVLVYKPYWIATFSCEGHETTHLVDGQTGIMAGELRAEEQTALWNAELSFPLPPSREVPPSIIALRCPECGAEQERAAHDHILVCRTCHVASCLTEEGLARRSSSYVHDNARKLSWLPFWRFPFEFRSSGQVLRELSSWRESLGLNAGSGGQHLWVPAFRLLGSQPGDRAFRVLSRACHAQQVNAIDSVLPAAETGTVLGASLPEVEARALGRLALFASLSDVDIRRLSGPEIHEKILTPTLTLGDGRLVLRPARKQANWWQLLGTDFKIPLLVAEGGPTLERYRLTVDRTVGPDLKA